MVILGWPTVSDGRQDYALWVKPSHAFSLPHLASTTIRFCSSRPVDASPNKIKEALEALGEPHRVYATPQGRENDEIQALTKIIVD